MANADLARLIDLYNRGDAAGALRLGEALLRQMPKAAVVHNVMGASNAALGRFERAAASFRTAATLTPKDPAAHNNLGLALAQMGAFAEAERSFAQSLRLDPSNGEAMLNLGGAIAGQGRLEDALAIYRKVAAAAPNHYPAQANLAGALRDAGRLREAAEAFAAAARLAPRDPAAHMNLGGVLSEIGETDAAIAACRKALAIDPDNVQAFSNLGVVYKRAGLAKEAAECYREAAERAPDVAEHHGRLGVALTEINQRQQAIQAFQAAIKLDPASAEHRNNLGLALSDLGRIDEAVQEFEAAIARRPNYPSAQTNLAAIRNRQAPLWHIGMMNDAPRNDAFFRAIGQVVREGDYVLEIGAGSGLLAMKAVDSGASEVVTCEMSKPVADAAAEIVRANGFAERVAVLNKKSTELQAPKDLKRKPDVIIAEILSSEFVGEGVIASLRDARARLLADGGTMLPAGGVIRIALLADGPGVGEQAYVAKVGGYDLSAFNRVTANKMNIGLTGRQVEYLAEPADAFTFDFSDPRPFEERRARYTFRAERDGVCLGVLQWNKVDLAEGIVYENDPRAVASHWSTPLYLFDAPLTLKAGQAVEIDGELTEDNVWFRLNQD